MAKCIICGDEITAVNKEHIIPFSLGNKNFTINAICRECNSLLGEKIDDETANSILAKVFRQQNGIPGHSGKIPNAFAEGVGENGEIIRLSKDFKPTIVTKVSVDDNKIHYQGSSKEEAIEIANKKLKRKKLPQLTEEQKNEIMTKEPEKYQPTISYNFSLNLNKINLEWIKIAYETLYYLFGEKIFAEKSIMELRQILYEYLYNDTYDEKIIQGKVGFIDKSLQQIIDNLNQNLDFLKKTLNDSVVHLIGVISENNELRIMIQVEGMLTGAVRVTVNDSSIYESATLMIGYPSGEIINQ